MNTNWVNNKTFKIKRKEEQINDEEEQNKRWT